MQEESTEKFSSARRKFLKILVGVLASFTGILLGIPLIGTLLGKSSVLKKIALAKVTKVSALSSGTPKRMNFLWPKEDAYIHETSVQSVWAIEHNPTDVTVFSPICPHAGCYYNWDAQAGQFRCPCHGSVFSISGKVIGGPAPRPLDTLPHEIKNGELYVKWERFKSGIPEKTEIS
jgi:menaquinol-cytochrome c reductase iron-sulfur subunit